MFVCVFYVTMET